MTAPVTPHLAATVVVIRDDVTVPDAPFEVMLLRRSAAMTFMAGAHVFPGGRVDDDDRFADAAACCDGLDGPSRFSHLDALGELACRVAAARELLEEAGVLFARRDGSWATADEAEVVRRQLDGGAAFEQLIREGGWRLALDHLVPFARIVTPRTQPKRFDTHFFLAELPAGQQARRDDVESDELVWVAPARAVEGRSSGEFSLQPPTWVTLLQLAAFDSAAELLAWGRARSIESVEPTMTAGADMILLSFPAASAPPIGGAEASGELRFSFQEDRGWRLDPPAG